MSSPQDLLLPWTLKLKAYSTARNESEFVFESEEILKDSLIFLDANENPWPPFFSDHSSSKWNLNRYPEPILRNLIPVMARFYEVKKEEILPLRGASEGIDLLLRACCFPSQDKIMFCSPSFDMYRVGAEIQGCQSVDVPLMSEDHFNLNIPAIKKAFTKDKSKSIKLIFICSPNNPTGNLMRREDILELCLFLKNRALVVVDEAYIEFTERESLVKEISNHLNLVVLRTLSKAFALAGARVGALLASSELISVFKKMIAPYPLTQPSIQMALKALSPAGILWMKGKAKQLIQEKKRLSHALEKHPDVVRIHPSDTHFLLLQVKQPEEFMKKCQKQGFLLRNMSRFLKHALRLSVGRPRENSFLLKALNLKPKEIQEEKEERQAWVTRKTKETDVVVGLNLDRLSPTHIKTGLGFFNHMLEQISQHSGFSLVIQCQGDKHVDDHHTIEDTALALGEALQKALGTKAGIRRYAFALPMDESRAQALLDLSGRPFLNFQGTFRTEKVGDMSTEMIPHFFRSLVSTLKASLHMEVQGENSHHMAEACFKVFGQVLAQAVSPLKSHERDEEEASLIPSTKGVL